MRGFKGFGRARKFEVISMRRPANLRRVCRSQVCAIAAETAAIVGNHACAWRVGLSRACGCPRRRHEVTWDCMSLKRRYENCLEFVDEWEKQSEGMTMRKMRSWNTLVHVDSSKAVWSRMPSMPVFEVPDDDDIKASNEGFWSWMFVWQRFSFQRLLTWERNTCTQPRMLAGTTNQITLRMAELWKARGRRRQRPDTRRACAGGGVGGRAHGRTLAVRRSGGQFVRRAVGRTRGLFGGRMGRQAVGLAVRRAVELGERWAVQKVCATLGEGLAGTDESAEFPPCL